MSFNMEIEKDLEILNLEDEIRICSVYVSNNQFMCNHYREEKETIERKNEQQKDPIAYQNAVQSFVYFESELKKWKAKYDELFNRYCKLTGKFAEENQPQ